MEVKENYKMAIVGNGCIVLYDADKNYFPSKEMAIENVIVDWHTKDLTSPFLLKGLAITDTFIAGDTFGLNFDEYEEKPQLTFWRKRPYFRMGWKTKKERQPYKGVFYKVKSVECFDDRIVIRLN